MGRPSKLGIAEEQLADLRRSIDGVDGALVALLARRFAFVKQVVEAKLVLGLPAAIPARVEEVVVRVRQEAEAQGFPPDTAEKLWRQLIADMIEFEESALR